MTGVEESYVLGSKNISFWRVKFSSSGRCTAKTYESDEIEVFGGWVPVQGKAWQADDPPVLLEPRLLVGP